MRLRTPGEVKRLASEDPGRLVRIVAASRDGRIAQTDLKSALTANVMTDAEFKSWWGKRRADVVRDPLIDIEGKGARAVFRVRDEGKAYHEEVVRAFAVAKGMNERLEAVREVLRMVRDNVFPAGAFEGLVNPFQAAKIGVAKMPASERIAWELLRQLLLSVAPEGFELPFVCEVAAELRSSTRPVETLAALQLPEFIMGCFPDVKEAFPQEWPKVLHDLGEISKPRIAGRIIDLLDAEGKAGVAADMVGRLISFPERNPECYLWAMGGLLDGTLADVPVGLDRHHLIEDLLTQFEAMNRPPLSGSTMEEKDRRTLANGIARILSERQHHHVAAMLVEMDVDEAREFYRGLEKRRLEESFVGQLRASLRKSRNDLEEERAIDPAEYLDAVLMCTQASFDQKMSEFRHLKSVEIPANSKAIGAAAELGDLRENSEYQTAKEHQKVLHRRLEELDLQLHKARVIDPKRITADAIDFGTRFTLRGEDGAERTLTMMGPWESDPDRGVISYQAPLGKAFYKKTVGDVVSIERLGEQLRSEEVVKIEKAI
jgi:transcription elongation factor GreA